ncbi:hypothetical protein JCM9533A_85950 [Catenuloplanes niger JCM 9533]
MSRFGLAITSLARKAAVGCAVLLCIGLVAGAAVYLSTTQASTRQSVLNAFDDRARLAAALTGDTLLASDPKTREWATKAFAGPVAGLDAALAAGSDASTPWLAVLNAQGTLLGASSASHAKAAAAMRADSGFRRAVESGTIAFGDVVTGTGPAMVHAFQPYPAFGDVVTGTGPAMVHAFQPYPALEGTRVLVVPVTVDSLRLLLRSVLSVTESRSYLVDGTDQVIVTAAETETGADVRDARLIAAAGKTGQGTVGDDHFFAAAVSGSDWRTIVVASRATLLAPVDSTARGAWLVFTAFATAVLLVLLIGASTLTSWARLAHARLHDPLTGLPNRTLFLARTEAAIARRRRQEPSGSGPVAALFLDLDGFKPVNDTYGHAVGDALLVQVAARLVAVTRPKDYVSRFGGDEFLVLCSGLDDENDAYAVADRIREELTEPYDVNGHHVRIGTSIGIAVLDTPTEQADTLINKADLALYRAKSNGRGRIERYVPDLADA